MIKVVSMLLLAAGVANSDPANTPLDAYLGAWEGQAHALGEPLDLRLEIKDDNGAPFVEVDFPQLVYADQVAQARLTKDGLIIELPFGFGEREFRREGELLLYVSGPEKKTPLRIELVQTDGFSPIRRKISFGASESKIQGELVLPPGEGSFPLLIHTAGAGNPTRTNWSYASWADHFARRGVASFIYDRRLDDAEIAPGERYSIAHHAADLSAAIDQISEMQDIDANRIGVMMLSRGAWIGLALAASDQRASVLIARGAAAVGIEEQEYQRIEALMRKEGFSQDAIDAAVSYMMLYFHVVKHTEDWPSLEAAARKAASAEWSKFVKIPESIDNLDWFKANIGYNPLANISGIRTSVFYAWGAEDVITPPSLNKPLFENLLNDDLKMTSRFQIYPQSSHTLEGPLNTDDDPDIAWTGMNPSFLTDLDAWLSERGYLAK